MLTSFWSGLGGELAKQWAARILTPALVFWAGGLGLVWWNVHGSRVEQGGLSAELQATAHPLAQLPAVAQAVLIVGALMILVGSALIADRLTLPLLKLLEGYWSRPAFLRSWLIDRRRSRRQRWVETVGTLEQKQSRGDLSLAEDRERKQLAATEELSEAQSARLKQLEKRQRSFTAGDSAELARGHSFLRTSPREDGLGMPTRLGDILRASERRPADHYGLGAIICWYRLWMLLPEEVKIEISQARLQVDQAVRGWLWGALFIVWAPWVWWVAVPVAIVVPLVTYNFSMLSAATLFGDLTETAFDLHRMKLYDALQLPRPTSPATERVDGRRLTGLLWHGETDPAIVYATPPSAPAGT